MGKTAAGIGANAIQYFTRNPRGGAAKAIGKRDAAMFNGFCAEHGIGTLIAHAPFTLNLCSDKEEIRGFARDLLEGDLQRVECLPGAMYNIHPGSHVGQGVEAGIALIADALGSALRPETDVTVLLETMSGKGSEIGGSFEELREIIDRVGRQDKLGVCLDTCHVFDAGYDIAHDLDGVLAEFDRVIGLPRLLAVHINDSMNPRGSRKDRHECIGEGCIGLDAFARVINHPALRNLPFYLETPNELDGYAKEIALLRKLYEDVT
jgi:deoxyribonuclease-4